MLAVNMGQILANFGQVDNNGRGIMKGLVRMSGSRSIDNT